MRTPVLLSLFVWCALGCDAIAGLGDFVPAAGGAATGGSGAGDGLGGVGAIGAAPAGGFGGVGGDGGVGGEGNGGTGGEANPCAKDLIIAEARTYGPGAGDDDFVEIYNPTDAPIALETISLAARTPSSSTVSERWRGKAGEMLMPGDRFTIVGAGFEPQVPFDYQLPSNLSFGDSIILLLRRGPSDTPTTIDIVCLCPNDCNNPGYAGCQGVVLHNPAYLPGNSTPSPVDDSVQRKPECVDTNSLADWVSGPATPNGPPP